MPMRLCGHLFGSKIGVKPRFYLSAIDEAETQAHHWHCVSTSRDRYDAVNKTLQDVVPTQQRHQKGLSPPVRVTRANQLAIGAIRCLAVQCCASSEPCLLACHSQR